MRKRFADKMSCTNASLDGDMLVLILQPDGDERVRVAVMSDLAQQQWFPLPMPRTSPSWKRSRRTTSALAVLSDHSHLAVITRGERQFRVVGMPDGVWTDVSGDDNAFIVSGSDRRVAVVNPHTLDVEVLQSPPRDGVGIHYCIHGTKDDFLVGGYEGEIWRCKNTVWELMSAEEKHGPISAVWNASPTQAYAVGTSGLLVSITGTSARHITWESPDHPNMNLLRGLGGLWGVAHFNGRLFVSGFSGVFEINEASGEPTEVELAEERPETTYGLACDGKRLVSWGTKDVYVYDGERWSEVT